eukprot:2574814-Lingulodinium_polyedra.AAC.1
MLVARLHAMRSCWSHVFTPCFHAGRTSSHHAVRVAEVSCVTSVFCAHVFNEFQHRRVHFAAEVAMRHFSVPRAR